SITESFCKHIVHVRNRSRWVCDNDRVIHAVKSCSEYREPVPFCYELIVSCLQLHLRSFEESNICAEYRNGLHRTMGIQDRDDRIIIHYPILFFFKPAHLPGSSLLDSLDKARGNVSSGQQFHKRRTSELFWSFSCLFCNFLVHCLDN